MGPGSQGKGIAIVLSGLTVSNVVGVPAITWLGQQYGWRMAYVSVAGIFVLTLVAVLLAVPHQKAEPGASARQELRIFRIPQAWLMMAAAAIGFGGFFAVYSYIAEVVNHVTHQPASFVPWVLAAIGVGMTVGNLLGGWAADRNLRLTMLAGTPLVIVSLAAVALFAGTPAGLLVTAFAVGAANALVIPSIQTRLIRISGDAQLIAAALNHSAFNVGNSLGAFLGGAAIAAGFGYLAPTLVGVGLTVLGFALLVVSLRLDRLHPPAHLEDLEPERVPALS
jgi:DHA1 family inner membrane transport protein